MTSPLGSVATESGRFYEWEGERFISVTNVLDVSGSKPALLPWGVKLTAEAARETVNHVLRFGKEPPAPEVDRIRKGQKVKVKVDWDTYWKGRHKAVKEESADRGTLIHDWTERWVLGQEPDPPQGLEQECMGIMRAFDKYEIEPIAAECTVYNRTYRYAGTGDLFARVGAWGGAVAMLDYKSGKSAWPETALQLAAYRNGEFIGVPGEPEQPVPETQAGGVLHVDFGTTHLIPYRCGPVEFEAFKASCAKAYWVVEEQPQVMNWAKIRS